MTSAHNEDLLRVTRVLCVGIGGTGAKVLERVRRIIVDEFGSLSALPIVGFVYIDTDGGVHLLPYRGQSIDFTPAEKLHISVSHHVVNQFKENYEQRCQNPYLSTPDDHIFEWFPSGLIRNLSTIENGAGAIRAIGRLALFKNYEKIKESLTNAYARVNTADVAALIERGIAVSPGLRVFVVGSLCGGTGSGIFLDIGYILRRQFESNVGSFESHAYFVISPELYASKEDVKANCYAALKELDYYSRPGTLFHANYPGEPPFSEMRPPYDFVYLISNSTPDGAFIIPAGDPDAMGKIAYTIAQKICLFFISSETARAAISARDNLAKNAIAMNYFDKHPRPNCQAYMTTGLATIYFPQDKINQQAVNKAKIILLEFWRSGSGQKPTQGEMRQAFANRCEWKTSELEDFLRRRIQEVKVEGATVPELIRRWQQLQEGQINAAARRAEQDDLVTQLPQRFESLLRLVKLADNSRERGAWLTSLVDQLPDIIRDIVVSIERFLEQILRPEDQFFGIENALNWLQGLKLELERIRVQPLDDRFQDTERRCQEVTVQMQNEIRAIRSQWWPYGRVARIQNALRRAVEQVAQLARRNYQWQVERLVRQAAEGLIEYVDVRTLSLNEFDESLQELISFFQREAKSLVDKGGQERIGLAIDSPADVEEVLRELLPAKEQERRQRMNQISAEMIRDLASLDADERPSLRRVLQPRPSREEMREALDREMEARAARINRELRKSAIQRFIELGDREKLMEHLRNLKHQSDILLPLRFGDNYYEDKTSKRVSIIAFHRPPARDDPYVSRFEELLRSVGWLEGTQICELPESEQHQVIFMTEYAAFPLRIINDLTSKSLRFTYQEKTRLSGQDSLHTNRSIAFSDILPPSDAIVKEVQALFFKCLGLDVFELEGDNLVVSVEDNLGFRERISLGNDWSAVIDNLSWIQGNRATPDGRGLTDFLRDELRRKIDYFVNNPDEWQGQRQRIIEKIQDIRSYPEDHINHAMVPIVAGKGIGSITDVARKGILEQLIEEIDNRIRECSSLVLPGSQQEKQLPEARDHD